MISGSTAASDAPKRRQSVQAIARSWYESRRAREPECGIAVRFMIRLVAYATGCTQRELLSPFRGSPNVARARQIAIYLLHTRLSVRIGDIAALFRRDRTTVAHTCRQVEDSRDDPATDDFITGLESMLDLAATMTVTE
jgi:chromosomal replication initiation ATPase DnaA